MFRRFERLFDPFADDGLKMPPQGFLAFCYHYARPALPSLLAVAICGAVIAVLEVMVYTYLGDLVNWLSSQSRETFFRDNWPYLLGMSAVILVLKPGVQFIWELFEHQVVMPNLPMSVRWRMHRYLLRQSMSFYQNEFAGRLATKVMQTAISVREVVTKIADILVYVTVYFVGAFIVVADADWRLALPFALWLVLYCITLRVFIPRLQNVSQRQADARSIMTGHVVDAYTNIATVKLFAHADREEVYAHQSMDSFLQTAYQQMRLVTILNTVLNCINAVLLFTAGGAAVLLWHLDAVNTGQLAIAIGIALRLQGMSQWILWEVAIMFENIGTVQDGKATIARERDVRDLPDAKPLQVTKGDVDFETVSFHYGKKKGVLDGVDLHIRPGEKIGLIGRSGAGKSTLVNLLLRFYDIERGVIRVDGQDISTVRQDELRAGIGMVTQDTSLLHRSIFENVAYGQPDATREDVIRALERAHAMDFVEELVDQEGNTGLDAQVGERGVTLSGGQRQRIAIARVLLKNAPILVLDEATSALDSEIEAAIQGSLFELMEGKTVIAIAHRLSTIATLDRLVVLDKGRIIEEGSHDELLRLNGVYAGLWARQSGGFINLDDDEAGDG